MKNNWKFWHWDHVGVCLTTVLLASIIGLVSVNLSMFNPVEQAFENFHMTDVYYEMSRSENIELNNDIVMVDMVELRDRGEIGQVIQKINACQPRVLAVDLIFYKEGDDVLANAVLLGAIDEAEEPIVFSSKLVDYDEEKNSFATLIPSFFAPMGDYTFAYGNVKQDREGGIIREYTLSQKYNEKPMYSLAYQTACIYMGEKPHEQEVNDRLIVYGDTDFPVINFKDVREYDDLLKDKIVLLGTYSDEEDAHFTPLGKMPGMKVQAYSILSYIQNRNIKDMPIWLSILLAFILCYLSSWANYWIPRLWPKVDSYITSGYYFLVAALLVWASFLSFMHLQYNVNLLYPLAGIALIETARPIYIDSIRLLYNKWHWRIFKHSIYLEEEE
jgi:CHASE2 domain-containing sensor protein